VTAADKVTTRTYSIAVTLPVKTLEITNLPASLEGKSLDFVVGTDLSFATIRAAATAVVQGGVARAKLHYPTDSTPWTSTYGWTAYLFKVVIPGESGPTPFYFKDTFAGGFSTSSYAYGNLRKYNGGLEQTSGAGFSVYGFPAELEGKDLVIETASTLDFSLITGRQLVTIYDGSIRVKMATIAGGTPWNPTGTTTYFAFARFPNGERAGQLFSTAPISTSGVVSFPYSNFGPYRMAFDTISNLPNGVTTLVIANARNPASEVARVDLTVPADSYGRYFPKDSNQDYWVGPGGTTYYVMYQSGADWYVSKTTFQGTYATYYCSDNFEAL